MSLNKRYSCAHIPEDLSSKRVSWGSKRIKKYFQDDNESLSSIENTISPQSNSDMDLSCSESSPCGFDFVPNKRRTGIQLISEFESKSPEIWNVKKKIPVLLKENIKLIDTTTDSSLKTISEPENSLKFKNNMSMSITTPQKLFLTPVKEESESAHSSGNNYIKLPMTKSTNDPGLLNNLIDFESHPYDMLYKSSMEWEKSNSAKPKNQFLIYNPQDQGLKNEIITELNELKKSEETKSKCLQDYNKFLESQIHIIKLTDDLKKINSFDPDFLSPEEYLIKQLKSKLSQTIDNVPMDQRWVETCSTSMHDSKVVSYKHVRTLEDSFLSELVIIVSTGPGRLQMSLKLFRSFELEDLNRLCRSFLQFLVDFLAYDKLEEVLQAASHYWCSFIKFSKSFEKMYLCIGYDTLDIQRNKFTVQGSFNTKRFEYTTPFASIDVYTDIFTEVYSLIK
jgi:hypothetical protein